MATVTATFQTHNTLSANNPLLQLAEVTFTVAPTQTYAQADNGILAGLPTLIQNARKNGRTVTLRTVMAGYPATKATNVAGPLVPMYLKTVAISTNDITFEITDGDWTTELANGLVPEQLRPFTIIVGFTES